MLSVAEYRALDAIGLARLVATGAVSPRELVETAISVIELENPAINAVVTECFEQALRDAADCPRGAPFAGVPFALKDLLGDYRVLPSSMGSRSLVGRKPAQNAVLVDRYRANGLIVLGKTNAPEFGTMVTTEGLLHGPCRNPWSLSHSAGGSSGGAAAAVAAGMLPIAHATDGGGSIRIPASACGLVGLKPSRARTTLAPSMGEAFNGFSAEHVLTRTVRDSRLALLVTAGSEPGDPYHAAPLRAPPIGRKRIAFHFGPMHGEPVDEEVRQSVIDVARIFEAQGHLLVEDAPRFSYGDLIDAFVTIWAVNNALTVDSVAMYLGRSPSTHDIEPLTLMLGERGKKVSAAAYRRAHSRLQAISREIAAFFLNYDAWLTPTLAQLPVRLGMFSPFDDRFEGTFSAMLAYAPYALIFNVTGGPSISVPAKISLANLPIGIMLSSIPGEEMMLLDLAEELETARPWPLIARQIV